METINSRIKKVRDTFCEGKNKEFAHVLGKNPNVTSNYVRDGYSVGRGVLNEIAKSFGVSVEWLLTGAGEMKDMPDKQDDSTGQLLRIIESQQETIARLSKMIERMQADSEKGVRISHTA